MDLVYNGEMGSHEGKQAVDCRSFLIELAQDVSPAARHKLANAVTELFEHKELSEAEHRLVVEIMVNLIQRAELDIREALAERISVLGNVPAEVVIFLANDEISVARPVLQKSPVLNDVDLVYIISSKGPAYWQSIAQRESLSPGVMGRLVDTGDAATALSLSDNPRISIPKSVFKRLAKLSLNGEDLQKSLLQRPEVDAELAVDLYTCVSQVLRREISQRFTLSPGLVENALDNLVEELCAEARGQIAVTQPMRLLARRFKERGEVSPVLMLKVLRRGQLSFFVALFAEKIGLPADAVIRLMRRDGGRLFVVACRSAGMMKSEFASIYLLSRSIRTEEKIVDQREMTDALKYYDSVKDADVQRLKREWLANPAGI